MSQLINLRKMAIAASIFAVVALGSAVAARADTVTFSLTSANAAVVGFPSPYGSVQVNLVNPNTATLTFTADESHPGLTYLFGDGGAVAANFNGAVTLVSGSITVDPLLLLGGTNNFTLGNAGQEDGFGDFSFSLNNGGNAFKDAVGGVTFTVTKDAGTWASAADVLTPNANGNSVAAHLFVCGSSPCDRSVDALNTGFVSNAVPEPASLLLLGTGLLGAAGIARRRFSKK